MAACGSLQDGQGQHSPNSPRPASWCPFTRVRLLSCVPRTWHQPKSPPSGPFALLHSEPRMPALVTGQTEPREPAASPAQVRLEGCRPDACPLGTSPWAQCPEPTCSMSWVSLCGRGCFPSTLCPTIPSAPRKTSVFLSRETGISGNFVGRIKGAKCPFDLQFLTWDFS